MNIHNITFRQLRTILAICEHGKIVSAANALGLTGPALTLQLKQLEDEAGLMLFERTREGMRPTDAGRAVVEAAQAIDERLRALDEEIDALKGVRKGSLTVGAVSTAKYFVPHLIAGFIRQFPDVDIKLIIGNRAETIANLRDHHVDLALMGRPPRDFPVKATVFGDHPLVVIASTDHPLAGRHDIAKEEVAREHFIVREHGSGTRHSFERFFADIPGKIEEAGTEMDSNETIKQAVMAGLGVAFISAHTIASEVSAGRMAVLDVVGLPVRRQWFSVVRADRVATPALAAFLAFLSSNGAQYLPITEKLYSSFGQPQA